MIADEPEVDKVKHQLPGDLAMWLVILAELSLFAILFFVFIIQGLLLPDLYREGQAQLNPTGGLYITMALLTASYFVAQALEFLLLKQRRKMMIFIGLACLCAIIYIVIKCHEYQVLSEAGFGLEGNRFFTLYFLITGFHLLHVILGLAILLTVMFQYRSVSQHGMKTAASYWHMVDLVWLVLFPLLYLVRI